MASYLIFDRDFAGNDAEQMRDAIFTRSDTDLCNDSNMRHSDHLHDCRTVEVLETPEAPDLIRRHDKNSDFSGRAIAKSTSVGGKVVTPVQ